MLDRYVQFTLGSHVMRSILLLALTVLACRRDAQVSTPSPSMVRDSVAWIDSVVCGELVVLDPKGELRSQRDWLAAHYPGHGPVRHALGTGNRRLVEILYFATADGRTLTECFDVTRRDP